MLQLRRITDQVFNRRAGDQVASGLAQVREQASQYRDQGVQAARNAYERSNEAARVAYEYAMNHRKATAAVLLGTGIAAALIYMVNRSGGYAAMRRKVLQRVRRPAARSRTRQRVANATE